MPSAPPRACARCGQQAQHGQPCQCRNPWEGSTHPSGNDTRWQQVRAAKLSADPICERYGCIRPATVVDHIKPLAEGGDRYAWRNLQSLCEPHHSKKTTEDAMRGKQRAR